MEFTVVQGDIAAESADALVNAAGTSLRMGSGVADSDAMSPWTTVNSIPADRRSPG